MWARLRAISEWVPLILSLVQLAWALPLRDSQTLIRWDISPYFIQVFWITWVILAAAWVIQKNWSTVRLRISKRERFKGLSHNLWYLYNNGKGSPGLLFLDWWLLAPAQRERALWYESTLSELRELEIPTPSDKAKMGVWAGYFNQLALLSGRGLYEEAKKLEIPTEYHEPLVTDDGEVRIPRPT